MNILRSNWTVQAVEHDRILLSGGDAAEAMEQLKYDALPPRESVGGNVRSRAESSLRFLILEIAGRMRFVTFAGDGPDGVPDADLTVIQENGMLSVQRREFIGPRHPRSGAVREQFVERSDGEIVGQKARFRKNLRGGDSGFPFADA